MRETRPAERELEVAPMYGYTMNKKDLQDRLRRIEGQVRGLNRMVDEDTYCIDILTQLNSVNAALKAVGMGLLDAHVRHCVRESLEQGKAKKQGAVRAGRKTAAAREKKPPRRKKTA